MNTTQRTSCTEPDLTCWPNTPVGKKTPGTRRGAPPAAPAPAYCVSAGVESEDGVEAEVAIEEVEIQVEDCDWDCERKDEDEDDEDEAEDEEVMGLPVS